jgi:solute carrier family 30 (zinc transporter), member 1
VAILISESGRANKELTFGWQRAQLLGAFFNGVFLLALGVSIFLQSLERFITLQSMFFSRADTSKVKDRTNLFK